MNSVGCILVTSYVGAVQHQEALLARNWHYVILDEGHKIRNPDAQVGSKELCAISSLLMRMPHFR
jgi:DNA excision repair protein ERCC-6